MSQPPTHSRDLVLTLLGPDHPGIVARVAAVIADHGGNWMHSRMVHLGGQFAGLVQASIPAGQFDSVAAAVEALQGEDLRVTLEACDPPAARPPATREARLEFVVPDQPGVLRRVTARLAAHGVNVEELATEFVAAPWSGELLFKAQFKVRAPEALDPEALRVEIEDAVPGMMLDLSFAIGRQGHA